MYRRFLYAILILFPIVMIILSIAYKSEPLVISSKILSIFYPFKLASRYIDERISYIKEYFRSNASLIEENRRLKDDLIRMQARDNLLKYCQNENVELKRFLDYKYHNDYKLIPVRVVDYIKSYSKDVVIIDAGDEQGIKKGMYAITDEGLAGKVIETSSNFSYVRLLSDRRSLFSVVSIENRIKGIVQGEGRYNQWLRMKYIPMSSNVVPNDIIVTAPSLETYSVEGIPIGTIKDVRQFSKEMFQEATIMPFVKFDNIEYLFIIIEI
jgi:rod shape-determining protein MreC